MAFYSATVVGSNEIGDREVRIVMRRTLLDWFLMRPAREYVFVQPQIGKTVWHYKGSGRRASIDWEMRCCEVVECARQNGK